MKIAQLMGFIIMSVIIMVFIGSITYVQNTLDARSVPRGEFLEFGILIFVVVLIIAFTASYMSKH